MAGNERSWFTRNVIAVIKAIPRGRVATYGLVARIAGNPRGARQVARILHSMSRSEGLPWHRVLSADGFIKVPGPGQRELQAALLEGEGVVVSKGFRVDLPGYLWDGKTRPTSGPGGGVDRHRSNDPGDPGRKEIPGDGGDHEVSGVPNVPRGHEGHKGPDVSKSRDDPDNSN